MRQAAWAIIAVGAAFCGCSGAVPDKQSGHKISTSGNGSASPGIVSFVSVTSDRVADVSSMEAWQSSFITPGMSDADKAQAVWKSVVAFRHQDEPARELVGSEAGHVHDPIKLFNVYGYSQCDCASAAVLALGRSVGLGARGRSLTSHSVAELSFDGGWHMFDAAYIDQFPQPGDGTLAGVDDMVSSVSGWLALHPSMDATNHAALESFMANGGYKNGPSLLANCPYYDANGLFPAKVQGWADTMQDYRAPSTQTEFGYTLGYRVNVQLRAGEKLVRNFSNVGHTINDDLGIACLTAKDVVGQGDMCYSPDYGDLAPGRVGNGSFTWTMPIAGGAWRAGALSADNVADYDVSPRVRADDASKPGVIVVRMPSSYVYLGGSVKADVVVTGSANRVVVEGSRNQGLDWTPLQTITKSGTVTIDLTALARRTYDYRLRFTLVGVDTGLDAVTIDDEIQHSQRALPALAMGDNHIRFTSAAQEGTITLEGATDPTVAKVPLTYGDFHPTLAQIADAPLHPTAGSGSITFPITTPGDLVRLRFGGFYRARDAGDAWAYQVSFDGGKTFTTVEEAAGPTLGSEDFVTFDKVPAHTRSAQVRYAGTQKDTLNLFDFRIDADYGEPAGGFAPVRVTYSWTENGQAKSDVHDVASADESWTIHCDGAPTMTSFTVERVAP
jgi:hypothetical protein